MSQPTTRTFARKISSTNHPLLVDLLTPSSRTTTYLPCLLPPITMMKLALFAALAGSAAAFAPSPVAKTSSTSLNADFSKELGAQMPLGFFDPLKILDGADQDSFDRLREIEIVQ